jgi:hypothetical protein
LVRTAVYATEQPKRGWLLRKPPGTSEEKTGVETWGRDRETQHAVVKDSVTVKRRTGVHGEYVPVNGTIETENVTSALTKNIRGWRKERAAGRACRDSEGPLF